MGSRAVAHPEAVEEAFPDLEVVKGREIVAAGEVGAEGDKGGVAGGAIWWGRF